MLHNKYYEVLKWFLPSYTVEVFGRELDGKVDISQKGIAIALQELEEKHILKSRTQGTLKLYSLNVKNTEIKDIIAITEFTRKVEFFSKHRKLAYLFKNDDRIVGMFGSYARGSEKPTSDLDAFIIGYKKKEDYGSKEHIINVEISIKYFSEKDWKKLLKEKNPLAVEIINTHVLMFGIEQFINYAWSDFFGLD